jgi:hypothetical protein
MNRRDFFIYLGGAAALVGAAKLGIYEADKGNDPAHQVDRLETSHDQALEGLGSLEAEDNDKKLFDGVMQFLQVLPKNTLSEQAKSLEAAHNNGLYSLNIVDLDGLNLSDPKAEKPVVHEYFKGLFDELANRGLGSGDVGAMVLCPEFVAGFNGPSTEYAAYLNMFLDEIEKVGPSAQTSNMVDLSETTVLLDKLPDVHAEKLDMIGVQAFANSDIIRFNALGQADISQYLTASKIQEVDSALGGNKPLWLNTGIIRADKKLGVNYSFKERMAIANATADVVSKVKRSGVNIYAVNLFAENKLNGRHPALNKEGRDFSFDKEDEEILTTFARRLAADNVELYGYAVPDDMLKAA